MIPKLERQIRKKCDKSLPNIEIFFERMKDKYESVNPLRLFLEESELYFQSLAIWKEKKEGIYISIRNFKPIRHKKVYGTAKPIR